MTEETTAESRRPNRTQQAAGVQTRSDDVVEAIVEEFPQPSGRYNMVVIGGGTAGLVTAAGAAGRRAQSTVYSHSGRSFRKPSALAATPYGEVDTIKDENRRSSARRKCLHKLILASILTSCTACATSRVVSGDKEPVNNDGRDVVASRTLEIAGSGPEHERLQAFVGNWNAATRAWRSPNGPVEKGTGTLSNFWMLDGRFVGQEYKSRARRPKYQGLGALGYDSIRKAYTSVWLDTASTSIHTATGSWDESANLLILEGVDQDPVTGTPVRWRSVTRFVNKKKYIFELFKADPDGMMFRALELIYTR